MISLDFKLSSGQVRTLLSIYHGWTLSEMDDPSMLSLRTEWQNVYFVATANALQRKGFVEHRLDEYPRGQCWYVTDRGRVVAEMIVEQARKIVALDESRVAREQRNAARAGEGGR